MIKNLFLLALIFCLTGILSISCKAQETDLQHGLINIGIGSVIGGVGAIINKEPDQKFGKTVLKGFAQGALGGYVVFESKRLVREFARERNYNYIWPSKLMNAAGSSIIENAAANRNFWERWHLNIAFNRIEIDTKNNFRLRYRIMPFSLARTIYLFIEADLDLDRSMVFGTLVFNQETNAILDRYNYEGTAHFNSMLLRRGTSRITEAHEIIHTYQYESFSGINTFFDRPRTHLEESNKNITLYNKIFYTDFNAALFLGVYNLERELKGYWDTSFEREARQFSQ